MAGNVTFGYGRNNPTHNELPNLVVNNLGGIKQAGRYKIRRAIRQLFKLRTDADYVPAAVVGLDEAREAMRDMEVIFRTLEINDE